LYSLTLRFEDTTEFAVEDQAQNKTFDKWPTDFSTTCGFFSEQSKDNVDSQKC